MTTTTKSNKSSKKAQEDPAVEALRKGLAAITLELNKKQEELESARAELEAVQSSLQGELESVRDELDAVQSNLAGSQQELQDTKVALATSERDLQATNLELVEANRHRVHPRPDEQQEEVFVVLRFRQPKPLPDGAYHFLARQRKAIDQVIENYKAKHSELDAVEIEELRVGPTPRAKNVYMRMKVDAEAPIEFSRQNFILKDGKTESEMIAYIHRAFSAYTQENSTASTA
ncbi:hypothetical protein BGX21_003274 [Mortierella sp. AD011]|nr:hypothetical protein BGX21_003274 [Mortierella sp. AD011]